VVAQYCASNGAFTSVLVPWSIPPDYEKELAEDGLHPNADGYAIMAPPRSRHQKALGTP
jgi:lysophospholipase L1-like esterase